MPRFLRFALTAFLGSPALLLSAPDGQGPAADLAVVLAASNVAGAPLTLEQSVANALARNFSVRIQKYSVDSAAADVIIAQSTYDPVLGVSWNKAVSQSPVVISTLSAGTGGAAPQTNDQQTTVSLTQNVITGGQVTADYGLSRGATNSVFSILNPAYDGTVSLSVSQPLLQGAGTDYSKAAIQSAELGRKIAGLNFKSAVLTMVFNVEQAYFNLIYARDQYAVGGDSLKLAQQLLDENQIKRQTGVLTDLDVVTAQAGVATARSNLIGLKQAMDNAGDALLQTLGEREFKSAIGPVAFPPTPETDVSFDTSYKLARDNGPNLAVAEATIEQFQLAALRAKRNNLPQLNAVVGGGYNSTQSSYSDAAGRLWNGSGYTWNAGLTLTLPWGLRNNKALYRQAIDSVKSEQAALDQTDQTLVVNVRSAVRAVQSGLEALAAAREASVLSHKEYDLERAKFAAGLDTSYNVLQAQNQLESSRVSEIQAEVNLRVALADLRFLEGTSLEFYHINLD